jgi:hypothetical protein
MNFHQGDVVRIGKGKVEYTITTTFPDGDDVHVTSNNTGTARRNVRTDTLTLVKSAEDIARDETPETDAPLVSTQQPNPTYVDETAGLPNLEHIPGETRREYFDRTGVKLDGRITNYGRDILAALQLKKNVFVSKGVVTNRTKGRTQEAKRTARFGRKGGDR